MFLISHKILLILHSVLPICIETVKTFVKRAFDF